MQNLRILACAVAVLGSLTAAGCGSEDCDSDKDIRENGSCVPAPTQAALVVQNPCGVAISEIHVASVGTTSWGDNLISTAVLPNGSVTIAVPCGSYAVELVDDKGHTATLDNVNLCASSANWTISSTACAAFITKTPGSGDPASGAAH